MAAGRRWAGPAGPNERRTRRGAWYSPNTPTAGHTANHVRSVRVCATGGVSIGVPRSRGTVNTALECLRQPARVIGLRSGHSAVRPGPTFSRGVRSAFDGQAQKAKMRTRGTTRPINQAKKRRTGPPGRSPASRDFLFHFASFVRRRRTFMQKSTAALASVVLDVVQHPATSITSFRQRVLRGSPSDNSGSRSPNDHRTPDRRERQIDPQSRGRLLSLPWEQVLDGHPRRGRAASAARRRTDPTGPFAIVRQPHRQIVRSSKR